jgi:hypothetical protein
MWATEVTAAADQPIICVISDRATALYIKE